MDNYNLMLNAMNRQFYGVGLAVKPFEPVIPDDVDAQFNKMILDTTEDVLVPVRSRRTTIWSSLFGGE